MGKMYIPDKLKIGFQERNDTYTGKLSYITYFDEKGVLRKENSWKGWIREELGIMEVDNVPTTGFVINKSGGGVPRWSERKAFVRVWHPLGFEFEINLDNLMFILGHCNIMKGKGIEGELVLAWEGAQLYLLPVESDVYQTMTAYSDVIKKLEFVDVKDLKIGYTYIDTKKQEEWIYLGRFHKFGRPSNGSYNYKNDEERKRGVTKSKNKHFFFAQKSSWRKEGYTIVSRSNVKNFFSSEADWGCVQDFTLFEKIMNRDPDVSEVMIWEPEYYEIDIDELLADTINDNGNCVDSFAFYIEGPESARHYYRVQQHKGYSYGPNHKQPNYFTINKTQGIGGYESLGRTPSMTLEEVRKQLEGPYKPYMLLVRHASGEPYKVYGGGKKRNEALAAEVNASNDY
ncbi:hypothetical protein [Bacillus thuringiensis]|uniref:hypothetical protein n=1 Tax=Bacillus thuringiensis TaxID=1428 RepID=UPI000A38A4CD|nr:hypothetical protein [Bacillus thuringiensis]OTZ47890.1 hypothetical protein BK762_19595 [Bacillus thuringiensis serovar toumanoffi]